MNPILVGREGCSVSPIIQYYVMSSGLPTLHVFVLNVKVFLGPFSILNIMHEPQMHAFTSVVHLCFLNHLFGHHGLSFYFSVIFSFLYVVQFLFLFVDCVLHVCVFLFSSLSRMDLSDLGDR